DEQLQQILTLSLHDALPISGLVLPCLADVHSHAFHRALRGRTHSGGGSFWTWREAMYALAAALTPERYERLARAVFAELALGGRSEEHTSELQSREKLVCRL